MKLTVIPLQQPCPLLLWAVEASTRPQIGKTIAGLAHGRPVTPASQVHEPWEDFVLLYGCFGFWHACRNICLSGLCVVEQAHCCRFKHVRGGRVVSLFLRAVSYR